MTAPHPTARWDGSMAAELTFSFTRELVESLKVAIPSALRRYEPATRACTVGTPDLAWGRLAVSLLGVHFPHAAVIEPTGRTAGDDFAVLHLLPPAPGYVVHAVYRALARELHPDRSGDHWQMVAINTAYERLTATSRTRDEGTAP